MAPPAAPTTANVGASIALTLPPWRIDASELLARHGRFVRVKTPHAEQRVKAWPRIGAGYAPGSQGRRRTRSPLKRGRRQSWACSHGSGLATLVASISFVATTSDAVGASGDAGVAKAGLSQLGDFDAGWRQQQSDSDDATMSELAAGIPACKQCLKVRTEARRLLRSRVANLRSWGI